MAGFIYTPINQPGYDEYWQSRNKASSEKTPKADLSQIPSLHEMYQQGDQQRQADAQQRQAEIAASPYAFTGQGMPMTPAQKTSWKQEFFAKKEH